MRFIAALVLMLLIPVTVLAVDIDRQKATDAAKSWLGLIDEDNYAQSWDTASTLFQNQISRAQWETAVQAARAPIGRLVQRTVASVDFATALPGAPDGQYAVIKFNTKFANKAAATETMTVMMDGGSWKAAGYYVR